MSFEVLGHRGTDPFLDHSAEAHAKSLDWGADWAELDVQMTSDGVLVVAHDTGTIPNRTYAQLLASTPGTMTLDQALDLVDAKREETGREIRISIEIKSPAAHNRLGLDIADALVDRLAARDIAQPELISISSFERATIERVARELLPAAGIDAGIDFVATSFTAAGLPAIGQWADSISVGMASVTPALVEAAHQAGLKVYVWTHAGPGEELQRLIDMGVDGVYSDKTRVAREYADEAAGIGTIYGDTAGTVIGGTAGQDAIYGLQGNDTLLGGGGGDTLNGDGGNDILAGGAGNDLLRGGAGRDVLLGGAGSDMLAGGAGHDVVVADGHDTIRYRLGDGIDLVTALQGDAVLLDGILPGGLAVKTLGSALVLSFADGGALVFEGGVLPGRFVFADGTELTGEALAALASGAAPVGILAVVDDLRLARDAAAAAGDMTPAPNLVRNGSFEDIDGTESRTWGRYDPDGVMPGWVNLDAGRVEQHEDTVSGVSAPDGAIWTDLDGFQNNVRLAQSIEGIETGAVYRLSFQIADTDLRDAETLTVSFGGTVVYQGAPRGAAWETIAIDITGGAGNGSDTLVFAQSGGTLNGVGLALDKVSVIKTADAPPGADDGNLIINGSFENINGTDYRSWGRYAPDGAITGWTNLEGGRIEQAGSVVRGVGAADGQYYADLDGWLNNVELAQDVQGVVKGATYALRFELGDLDVADNESLVVTFGGEVVYRGAPKGAAWESIALELKGGAGDGSDRLVIGQTGGSLDGYGLALDNVSMIKTADPYTQDFAFIGAQTWSDGTPEAGFNATFRYTLTEQDLAGGSARAWAMTLGHEGAAITTAWMDGFNAPVAFGRNAAGQAVLTTEGMGYQLGLKAGDVLTFTVQGHGADFSAARATFAFADTDAPPPPAAPQSLRIEAAATNDWGSGLMQAVTVRNEGHAGIAQWAVELDLPDGFGLEIGSVWGATVTRDAEGDLIFTAAPYNAAVAAGGAAGFGFVGSHAGGAPVLFTSEQFAVLPHADAVI